jgi:hypothetical protein
MMSSRAGVWGVELICSQLQVAPSSYYEVKARQRRPPLLGSGWLCGSVNAMSDD